MNLSMLFEYLPYALITNFTPGPNNILALNSTKTYGFKRSWKVLLGICLGFTCIMIICGIVCISLKKVSDTYQNIMKYIGTLYTQSALFIFLFILGMSVLGAIAALIWALAGSVFQTFLNKHYKIFNTIMALILIKSAFDIILIK